MYKNKLNLRNVIAMTICLVGTTMFSGCNKDNEPEQTGQVAVNLSTDIKPPTILRAANDQWEANDKVGFYMKRAKQVLTDAGAVYSNANNVQMSLSGQNLVADPPVMYPTSGNVDFIAYYPYNANVNAGFTIPINVAEQASGLPIEVLYSNNVTNQAPTNAVVRLDFLYSLAKIELTVTGGTNSNLTAADFASMTVTVEGLYTQATLQLANGTFTNYSGKQPIALYRQSNDNSSVTFEMLALPADEDITFKFNVGGEVYSYEMTASYTSAKLYSYAFSLDYPPTPEQTATMLSSYIIPRDEEPVQNISVNVPNSPNTWTGVANSGFGNDGFDSHIHCIAYGNGRFVAGGNSKKIFYSIDGENWAAGIDNTVDATAYLAAAYVNGKFITSNYRKMLYSTDGKNWTAGSDELITFVLGITYGNEKYIAVGSYGMTYSIDGENWTLVADNTLDSFPYDDGSGGFQTIAYGAGKFVAGRAYRDGVGFNTLIVYSTNGENWTPVQDNTFFHNNIIRDIAYGNDKFIAVYSDGVAYSLDGINWTVVANTTFSGNWVSAVAYGGGYFVAVGNGKIAYSRDGENWAIVTKSTLDDYSFTDVVYGDGKFVAVGLDGKMAYSNSLE